MSRYKWSNLYKLWYTNLSIFFSNISYVTFSSYRLAYWDHFIFFKAFSHFNFIMWNLRNPNEENMCHPPFYNWRNWGWARLEDFSGLIRLVTIDLDCVYATGCCLKLQSELSPVDRDIFKGHPLTPRTEGINNVLGKGGSSKGTLSVRFLKRPYSEKLFYK